MEKSEKIIQPELPLNNPATKSSLVSERYWWKVVALCFVGWVLIYADRTILNPVMPQIAAAFHINDAQLGLINSIFFLTYALSQMPFGILAEKVGRKTMITIGFLLFGLMTLFSGIVASFGMFLIVRALPGLVKEVTTVPNMPFQVRQFHYPS